MGSERSTAPAPEITPELILVGHTHRVQALAARLRRLVADTVPEAMEKAYPVWHGSGFRHPQSGYFCGIFPQKAGVRLYFEFGAFLADPEGLLQGNSKQTRYAEVRRQRDIRVRPLRRLIREALECRQPRLASNP